MKNIKISCFFSYNLIVRIGRIKLGRTFDFFKSTRVVDFLLSGRGDLLPLGSLYFVNVNY